ncbi:MAG: peptidoglycan D,D-transpeptidase FtsI family protein [Alphaproteobacteria bacterium]
MNWRRARYNAVKISGERQSALVMAQSRLSFLCVGFILCYMMIMVRMVDLSVVQNKMLFSENQSELSQSDAGVIDITARRGSIYDRNGFLVATTLKSPSLFVDPSLIISPERMIGALERVFPDLDKKKTLRVLSADNRFGWIKRGITPEQQERVLEIGSPALGFQYEQKRVYPQKSLFSHLVGFTDRDGLGLSGVERSFDDILSRGEDVHLTMDLRLQHLVRREVQAAISDFAANAGAGVIMDAQTGEVLAGVSLPDFDVNLASHANDNEKFNRLTLGVYELGSMFKIFSTAALLELHDIPMDFTFDARKPIKIGRFSINDYHAQKRVLTVPEVFMHSSNIGSAMMGQMVGGDALRGFYADLGLMDTMNTDVKEVGSPLLPNPWREVNTMTAAYGHGLATTPLQMSAGVATVVNGGISVRPIMVKRENSQGIKSEVQVMSEKTSERMRKLLRLVVTEGTGKNADVSGYMVGGKTGTAEKSVNGRYDRGKLISSFVGAFPMNDPKYVVMVMVDEPHGNKKSYGYATAGWVAAPAVKRIVSGMASVLGIPSDQYAQDDDISNDLTRFVHDPKKKQGGKKLVSYSR